MAGSSCRADWVELIFDNYKSRHCGQTTKPWSIITDTNFITIRFFSDNSFPRTGFLAIWSPTSAPPTYPPSTGCEDCTFPSLFNDRIFDTCTSIDGDQPWCQANVPAPVDQGNHLINVKSYCSDADSSCPNTPQMSTHVNNQPSNCCKFYKLSFNLCLTLSCSANERTEMKLKIYLSEAWMCSEFGYQRPMSNKKGLIKKLVGEPKTYLLVRIVCCIFR